MRRHIFLPAVAVGSALVLSACGIPTAPDQREGAGARESQDTAKAEVRALLAKAPGSGYSTRLWAVTLVDGKRVQLVSGPVNLDAPLAAILVDRTPPNPPEDFVITPDHVFRRPVGKPGKWLVLPASAAKGGIPTDRLREYAGIVLDKGGKAAGPTVRDGVRTRQVTGRISGEDLRSLDAPTADRLKGVRSILTSVWLDDRGRPVRVEQRFTDPNGAGVHSTLTFTGVERPVTVHAPPGALDPSDALDPSGT